MFSWADVQQFRQSEWKNLKAAPFSFAASSLVCLAIGYVLAGWYYSGRLADAEGRVALRNDEIQKKDAEITSLKELKTQPPSSPTELLHAWGGGRGGCYAEIVSGQLSLKRYVSTHNLMLICGVPRMGVDRVTDTLVAVSGAFNIEPSFRIDTKFPVALSGALAVEHMPDKFSKARPGEPLVIATNAWFELVVVPKGVDASNIRSLADVPRFAGVRLGNALSSMEFVVTKK